jgi:3-oxoacyl-[acyl-carrier protein] reductase
MLNLDLSNRIAIVTGASGELGRVITRTIGGCGADVAVHCMRQRERAERLCAEVRDLGRRAMVVQGDVGDRALVMAIRDAVLAGLGSPDIVVANAVSQYKWTSVLEQPIEDFTDQYRSCVAQVVLMAQAFVPAMVERRRGRFIAINTECSMQCLPNQGAYASAKRGMDGALRVLAREVGKYQITVNQVAPGWMISDRQRGTAEENQPDYQRTVALGRRGYDQDIANAVAFLASDLAQFISGVYLPVCGGNVMPAI